MKTNPPPFDLTKKGSSLRVESVTTPPPAGAGADLIIEAKGPRLNIEPIFDHLFVSDPDAGAEEAGMSGGIYTGRTMKIGCAVLDVVAAGPLAKFVKKGDRVLLNRPQVEQVVHDGHSYWRTTETAVVGIIRP